MLSVKEWKRQVEDSYGIGEAAVHKVIDEQLLQKLVAPSCVLIDWSDWNRFIDAGGTFQAIKNAYRAGGWDAEFIKTSPAYVSLMFSARKDPEELDPRGRC